MNRLPDRRLSAGLKALAAARPSGRISLELERKRAKGNKAARMPGTNYGAEIATKSMVVHCRNFALIRPRLCPEFAAFRHQFSLLTQKVIIRPRIIPQSSTSLLKTSPAGSFESAGLHSLRPTSRGGALHERRS